MFVELLIAAATLVSPAGDVVDDARRFLAAGEAESAVALLDEALAATKDSSENQAALRVALADAHLALDAPATAASVLEPLVDADDYAAQHALGRVMRYWGDFNSAQGKTSDLDFLYGEAKSYLARAVELAPKGEHAALIDALELDLYGYGEHMSVLKRAEKALRSARDDGELLLLVGTARLYTMHDLKERHGEKPSRSEVKAHERLAKEALGELERAAEALGNTRHEPHSQLAWIHESQGNASAAVASAVRVVEILGDDALFDTLYRLARRYALENELDAAAHALLTMAEHAPEELTAWVAAESDVTAVAISLETAAFRLTSKSTFKKAKLVYRALLDTDPKNAAIWNNYAFMCRETRDYEESYRAYAKAVEIDDQDPRTLNDTALILHYHLNRRADARPLYEQAIATAEEQLKKLGLTAARKAYLREALRDAKNNLARIQR